MILQPKYLLDIGKPSPVYFTLMQQTTCTTDFSISDGQSETLQVCYYQNAEPMHDKSKQKTTETFWQQVLSWEY